MNIKEELKYIVLDELNCSILKAVHSKIKQKVNYRVFLCDRSSGEKEKITFCELTKNGGLMDTIEDEHILDCVTKCYLENFQFQNGSGYYSCIYSKIGSLGVILFEAIDSSKGIFITDQTELLIQKSMSVIGHGILSNLCVVDNSSETQTYNNTVIDKKRVRKYIPFAYTNCVSMFVNIKNFVGIQLDKDETFNYLRKFTEKIENIAKSHYGIVNCIFGGNALIVFNVLLYEDIKVACRRAVCTAVQIKDEMKDSFQIEIGIGSNSGETFFFDFSKLCLSNYTCIGKIVSNTKKIEHISGRPVDVAKNGMKFPTGSLEHIMLSETIHSNLECDLKKQFKTKHVPQILYTENLYGIPNKPEIKKCQGNHRKCVQCTKTR